ncbi:MAG: 50S ribosomal protein L4 [Candidatus Marsarchaeota archaeon]|nr:50S ribosomal protein L4 [Candidatus Marsarchaeota archaeon]
MNADVFDLNGKVLKPIDLPSLFEEQVRTDLILRAIASENSYLLQPQGSYKFAGMETSAVYVGRMNVYRTGRHMGIAIRPREKLGGGVQGKVKRIPSATKGRRAHPHKVEKILNERINKKEYQKAIASAISYTCVNALHKPIVVTNDIETLSRTRQVVAALKALNLQRSLETKKKIRKGLRRSSKQNVYKKTVLIVVSGNAGILKSGRNIAGVDVCTTKTISANLLVPGGNSKRAVVWSENAVKSIQQDIKDLRLK